MATRPTHALDPWGREEASCFSRPVQRPLFTRPRPCDGHVPVARGYNLSSLKVTAGEAAYSIGIHGRVGRFYE
jgi:hypothetical protein